MSRLTPAETKAVVQLAHIMYDFLPGKPHPYANAALSFPAAAQSAGVGEFWPGGAKEQAIAQLLRQTLEQRRNAFCPLVSAIVTTSLIYRERKNPLRRGEVEAVNDVVKLIGFKIPELWEPSFLDSLSNPAPTTNERATARQTAYTPPSSSALAEVKREFFTIDALPPVQRGFAFERVLRELFDVFGMAGRSSFRLVGEQIDGSFELGATYLVEARWQALPIGNRELRAFAGAVASKAQWSRGLFVSYCGFSDVGLEAFERGAATNIICIDGQDLFHVLDGKIDLRELIDKKARRASETNEAFVPARALFANVT